MKNYIWTTIPLLACGTLAFSAPIAIESFVYDNGAGLNAQNGGSGWNGAWTAPPLATLADPAVDLTYPELPSSGNSLSSAAGVNIQNIERSWTSTDLTDDGDEIWFSMVVNFPPSEVQAANNELRFQLFQGGDTTIRNNGTDTMLVIDELGSVEIWGMDTDNVLDAATTITAGTNHLIVGQYVFSDTEGSDTWNLWIDPALSVAFGDPTLSVTGDIITDGEDDGLDVEVMDLRFIRNAISIDEIRLGSTLSSVLTSESNAAEIELVIERSNNDLLLAASNLSPDESYQFQEATVLSANTNWVNLGAPVTGVTESDLPLDLTGKPRNFFRVVTD